MVKPQEEKKKIRMVCAWCRKEMEEKEADRDGVSHGICNECGINVKKEIEENKKRREQKKIINKKEGKNGSVVCLQRR